MRCVVSGSFRRDLGLIRWVTDRLERAGAEVIAPVFDFAVNPSEDFVRLNTDNPDKTPYALQLDYFRAIRSADVHVVANPRGKVGLSAAAEMACAAMSSTVRLALDDGWRAMNQLDREHTRQYPHIWFANEVTHDEQAVLSRLPWRGGLWLEFINGGIDVSYYHTLVAETRPMTSDHPDRPILLALCRRVLGGLA